MKSELAMYGGPKAVSIPEPHFQWPEITPATEQAVLRQLHASTSIYNRSGIIAELEDRLTDYFDSRFALLTNSGTSALLSLYVGAGLGAGDEVIVPAYGFHATATPLFFTGATPVLADCDEDGNIDPDDIPRRITSRTRAVVVSHMWGMPGQMQALKQVVDRLGLQLFEDGSHAHGARYHGVPIGAATDASAFSMQAQKGLPAGEGGFLLTDDEEVQYRALLLGHFNKRCRDEIPDDHALRKFDITGMGLKLRIHPLAAAIAFEQFDRLDWILERRRDVARKMADRFGRLPGLCPPTVPAGIEPSWYAFAMRYRAEELSGLPVDLFHRAAVAEGCSELDRPGATCPLAQHPLFQDPGSLFDRYQGRLQYRADEFPGATAYHQSVLKLPVPHGEDAEEIIEAYGVAFEKVIEHRDELLKAQARADCIERSVVEAIINHIRKGASSMNETTLSQMVTQARNDGIDRFVVGAIINHAGTVLVLQRPADDFMGGIWELPSGTVEQGESLNEALHREVAEETGLTVRDIDRQLPPFDYQSKNGRKTRQFNFGVSVTTLRPIRLTEHENYRWISKEELPTTAVSDSVRCLLEEHWPVDSSE